MLRKHGDLRNKGIGFRSINEGAIDTTCASGELIFNIFSALAQFERRLIQERTKAGLAAARARGRNGGRPKVTAAETKVVLAKKLQADKSLEIDDICQTLKMSWVGFLPVCAAVARDFWQCRFPVVLRDRQYDGNSSCHRPSGRRSAAGAR